MLKNAMLYQEQLKRKMWEIWYDPKYQYYYGGDQRWTPQMSECDYDSRTIHRAFVSVDPEDNVVGYIAFSWDSDLRMASSFGIMNFTDDIAIFGHDLKEAMTFIFETCQANVLEFAVVRGNPIEKSYDRIATKYGGRIVGIRTARARDMAGNLCDDKLYEITREGYLAAKERMKRK